MKTRSEKKSQNNEDKRARKGKGGDKSRPVDNTKSGAKTRDKEKHKGRKKHDRKSKEKAKRLPDRSSNTSPPAQKSKKAGQGAGKIELVESGDSSTTPVVTIELDPLTLQWFQKQGLNYLKQMSEVLSQYVHLQADRRAAASPMILASSTPLVRSSQRAKDKVDKADEEDQDGKNNNKDNNKDSNNHKSSKDEKNDNTNSSNNNESSSNNDESSNETKKLITGQNTVQPTDRAGDHESAETNYMTSLNQLSNLCLRQGDYAQAFHYLEKAVRNYEEQELKQKTEDPQD
jgi:uncharacterized protein (DUF4415 family)